MVFIDACAETALITVWLEVRVLPGPPRTKKLLYLAFLSFSSYEFLRTFWDFAAHLATSPVG